MYVFHFRSVRISFINKVTRVHKAMTVANNTSLYVSLEFIPVSQISVAKTEISVTGPDRPLLSVNTSIFLQRKKWRCEISETEPARLPGLICRGPYKLIIWNSFFVHVPLYNDWFFKNISAEIVQSCIYYWQPCCQLEVRVFKPYILTIEDQWGQKRWMRLILSQNRCIRN